MTAGQVTEEDHGGQWRYARTEEFFEDESLDWYPLTPQERWRISHEVLWPTFLALGGSLEPEVDTQSPSFDPEEHRAREQEPKPFRVITRSGV